MTTTKNHTVRYEKPEDRREVENLIRESFWNVYRPGCSEHYVIHVLRDDPAFSLAPSGANITLQGIVFVLLSKHKSINGGWLCPDPSCAICPWTFLFRS